MKTALMITCLGDVLRPEAGKATVRLLRRLGVEVDFPERQTCCGQPMFNSGFEHLARRQAMHTIQTFADSPSVVTPSGSCAAMVKIEYPRLLEDEPAWRSRAEELAAKTHELSDFIVNRLGVLDVGARYSGRVAYHFACHLRMLNLTDEVPRLIQHVAGASYVPLIRQDQCCGFGGSFAVRYGNISGALVNDKVNCILDCGADAVVSTDTGCLMNIGGRVHRLATAPCSSHPQGPQSPQQPAGQNTSFRPFEVLHIAELLDRR